MHSLPKIVAIGAGNIASHLIPALEQIGCDIRQVYSRQIFKARSLAHRVNSEGIDNLSEIITDADWYIIMIADDGIKKVIEQLPEIAQNAVICHTSGATESEILHKVTPNYGSFYPLQSFKKETEVDLQKTPFLLNASNAETLRYMRVVARQISESIFDVTDEERLMYHLAAVYANNFTNHMACIADQILDSHALLPQVLRPIMESTFTKILSKKPCEIQTGPAARNDVQLQKKHLNIISNNEQWSKIYKTISESISKSKETHESSK